MTRFICHGCGPIPCRAEVPGVDASTLRCIVESDEAMNPEWKLETEEPDEDDLFDDEYTRPNLDPDRYDNHLPACDIHSGMSCTCGAT